jgi:hypothetical protein
MDKKQMKDVAGLVGISMMTGIGASMSPESGKALSGFSGMLPVTGTIMGAGMALGELNKLTGKKKKGRIW